MPAQSIFALTDTWNNGATTFDAIAIDVTDTASAAASRLLDLKIGGVSRFSVRKDGRITTANGEISSSGGVQINSGNTNDLRGIMASEVYGQSFAIGAGITRDIYLQRDAANTLAQRNGVNAQLFHIYNTFTDVANWERMRLGFSGGSFIVGTAQSGTGSARELILMTGGAARVRFATNSVTRWNVQASGELIAEVDNTYDIGASGANRPRNIFLGNVIYPQSAVAVQSTTGFFSIANDVILARDAAGALAQRDGVNPQALRLYNTFTDASNYERAGLFWTSNVLVIETQNLGTGQARDLYLSRAGGNQIIIGASNIALGAPVVFQTDATRDIGASGAQRPRDLFLARQAVIGGTTETTSRPVLDLTQTWNNVATTFTGLRANITDTASAAGSLLVDLQTGGVTRFSIDKNGNAFGNTFRTGTGGGEVALLYYGGGVWMGSTSQLSWGSASANPADLILVRDAADTLAQRRGVNAQTFRLYSTFTDASNYERGYLGWNAGNLVIGTQGAGTGASNRSVSVSPGGTIWQFQNNGVLIAPSTAAYEFQSRARLTAPALGVILLTQHDGTNAFDRLQFGGTTSSFPALKRSGTKLMVRLADDSANASLDVDFIQTNSTTAAALPTAVGRIGARYMVSDSNVAAAGNFGAVVAGGGANVVPVYSDGTNWRIG